ncbi:MAG: thioredoxin fold domain-containing protein [Candidatus Obscuribacterales bacterium]|jgi:thioredoxin 1|nr:thioredoxin fold domain-containing protein [Candidatus Obscuribacterales bacterium]
MIVRSKTSKLLDVRFLRKLASTLLVILVSSGSLCLNPANAKPSTTSPANKAAATTNKDKPAATTSKDKPAAADAGKDKAPAKDMKAAMPIIYDFGAAWCVPCKKFAPVFDKVAEKYKGKVDFQHIDADDEKNKALVDKYKVMSLPTIVFVDKTGKTVDTKNKVLTEAELIQQTDSLIK